MIRKANMQDIDQVEAIYTRIHDEEEAGHTSTGWIRAVYPTRRTAEDAVARKDMFVETDGGEIVAAGIINQQQMAEYANCSWHDEAAEEQVMVLHTLAVDPQAGGRGYGTAFVKFYESYAMAHGCPFLRMDTNEKNTKARAMYAKLGFHEPDIVDCDFNGIPGVKLVCLEKRLPG